MLTLNFDFRFQAHCIVKICEEEGRNKGSEIFGDFGATVGIEAALLYGKKAGIAKVKEMVIAHAIELGKAAGKEAGNYDKFKLLFVNV